MTTGAQAGKTRVFISYAREQEEWKDRLLPHLVSLSRYIDIHIWHDGLIAPGEHWREAIETEMSLADVALFLLSPDFLASEFVQATEVATFLERREKEGLLIVPILIRPCVWQAVPWLESLQMFPRNGQSVANDYQSFYDTPYAEVAQYIFEYAKRKREPHS